MLRADPATFRTAAASATLPFDRADLFTKVLEVRMQVLENREQTRRQRVCGQHCGKVRDDGPANWEANAERQQEAMHLVAGFHPIAHE